MTIPILGAVHTITSLSHLHGENGVAILIAFPMAVFQKKADSLRPLYKCIREHNLTISALVIAYAAGLVKGPNMLECR